MNKPNPTAVRAAILAVELTVFFIVTALLVYFLSYAGARELADGDTPPAYFPVIAYDGDRERPESKNYLVVSWADWESIAGKRVGASLLLPESAGRIRLGDSEAIFSASGVNESRQDVELTWRAAGGEHHVRYVAEARSISPRYYRTVNTNTFLIGAALGFVAGMFSGRALRRRWLPLPGPYAPTVGKF
jgi:hypothetical protein